MKEDTIVRLDCGHFDYEENGVSLKGRLICEDCLIKIAEEKEESFIEQERRTR